MKSDFSVRQYCFRVDSSLILGKYPPISISFASQRTSGSSLFSCIFRRQSFSAFFIREAGFHLFLPKRPGLSMESELYLFYLSEDICPGKSFLLSDTFFLIRPLSPNSNFEKTAFSASDICLSPLFGHLPSPAGLPGYSHIMPELRISIIRCIYRPDCSSVCNSII